MELLLNLAWLLLAIPAFQLWRKSKPANQPCRFTSLQCLLALSCALVVLFPVISATDDLHAMRAEMDESPVSKRSVRQASNEKGSIAHNRLPSPPVLVTWSAPLFATQNFPAPSFPNALLVAAAPCLRIFGRAPPATFLA